MGRVNAPELLARTANLSKNVTDWGVIDLEMDQN